MSLRELVFLGESPAPEFNLDDFTKIPASTDQRNDATFIFAKHLGISSGSRNLIVL